MATCLEAGRPAAAQTTVPVILNLPPGFHELAAKAARALGHEELEVYLVRCACAGMASNMQAWVDSLLALEGETDGGFFARLEADLLKLAGVTP